MNNHVYFTQESLNLNLPTRDLLNKITQVQMLITKYQSDFITFRATPDFHNFIANELVHRSDMGYLMTAIYDGLQLQSSDTEATTANKAILDDPPVHQEQWLAIFCSESADPEKKVKINPNHIDNEHSLVTFCSRNLAENNYTSKEYAHYFPAVYRNLYFLGEPDYSEAPTYAHLNNMDPPFHKFIQTLTQCLNQMNSYEVIPQNADDNIIELNNLLPVSVTREGKGKGKRTTSELKRNFTINGRSHTNINCEYHAKFTHTDNQKNARTHYSNRMYFGFIQSNTSAHIAIAHIGQHL